MENNTSIGFRTQLFLTVALILAVVVVASTTVTFAVTRAQAYRSVGDVARAQIEQFTRLAVFPAIVGPENKAVVDRFIDETTGQQAIVAVELRTSSGKILGRWGSDEAGIRACGFESHKAIVVTQQVVRRDGYWCAVGPIRQGARDNARRVGATDSVIGELRIVDSVADTRLVVNRLAAWNFGAGLSVLVVGVFLAWRGVRRLTDPLARLAEVMRQLKSGSKTRVRAELTGPTEVLEIATVFNELILHREQEALTLENEVEARTRELRAASETARAAVRYKNVFMASVTHEMRTPLHVIHAHALDVRGELEFIAEAVVSRRYVNVILKQADELLQRVNQILELARAESATGDIEEQSIDLHALTADMRERSLPLATEHENTLQFVCDPIVVVSDRDKIWVILSNLVTNACQFTRRGLVQVELRASEQQLVLSVRDNGPGIPAELQERLWQEFTQVERRDGRARGFGLGLAIVKRLATVLRGKIELDSQPGRGTSVRVSVPLGWNQNV